MEYVDFLKSKQFHAPSFGFTPTGISLRAFDWQVPVIDYACRKGRAALWEGCGLGKTFQQLEWSRLVCDHTGGSVLILAPLAVAEQSKEEAEKFEIEAVVCCIELWSNPSEVVLSPFAGIGSEGVSALEMGRQFIGMELKESYFKQAVINLTNSESHSGIQSDLFGDQEKELAAP